MVGFEVGQQPQLDELGVGHVVEAEEVGACLLDGVAVSLQCVGVCTGQELSAAVSETLVQVGVQLVALVAVLFYKPARFSVVNKLFLKTVSTGCAVVGVGDIGDGDALRSVLGTYPVGVRQIDADGRRGVLLAAEHGGTDGVCRDALDLGLAEARVDGRVVFKPLGVAADGLGAARGLEVAILDDAFPRAFQPEGVAIDLDEAVDEVYPTLLFADPLDAIVVEAAQRAGAVVVDEQPDAVLLARVLGHLGGLLEPVDDVADGVAVASAHVPHLLVQAVLVLDERRVESVGDGLRVVLGVGFLALVVVFGLLLGDALVEVAGRGEQQVLSVGFVDALGQHVGVEDDGEQLTAQRVERLAPAERQAVGVGVPQLLPEPLLGELGLELVGTVVVVYAAGEPQALQVFLHGVELAAVAVGVGRGVDGLEHASEAQVVASVLVERDVAPPKCGLGQTVD